MTKPPKERNARTIIAKSRPCPKTKTAFHISRCRLLATALSYGIIAARAVLTHDIAHVELLVGALRGRWIRMMWLVFLIVEILVMSLGYAPH